MPNKWFSVGLAILAAAGTACRALYLAGQERTDPYFQAPILDGAIYLEWARTVFEGSSFVDGAFYLAPGYPHFLGGLIALLGENYYAIYAVQHVLVVATAVLLGITASRYANRPAGLATAALVLLYHPILFFASVPVGETLAIFLLAAAICTYAYSGRLSYRLLAGFLLGLAILVRPNFLLVLVALAGIEIGRRKVRVALAFFCAALLVIVPVTIRNIIRSGHAVPVSSNAGITLYHGNGPGASGIFTWPEGFSGRVETQREEATRLARKFSGQPSLDPVEADRWWGKMAFRTRVQHPAETAELFLKRTLLLAGNDEIGLDYNPSIDENRFRDLSPIPFAVLLGLAVAGCVRYRKEFSQALPLIAVLACLAVVPLAFYMSSRYRLPFTAFLAIPAGTGAWSLISGFRSRERTVWIGLGAGLLAAVLSFVVPNAGLKSTVTAGALSNRGVAWNKVGRLDLAQRDFEHAMELEPNTVNLYFNHGTVMVAAGRFPEAEDSYRKELERNPYHASAAGNLSAILLRQERYDEAISCLAESLTLIPDNRICWTNLVVAYASKGDLSGARNAILRAEAAGIALNPQLKAAVENAGEHGP